MTEIRLVFVSHSHVDHAFSSQLASDLSAALGPEVEVWHDAGSLVGGEGWWGTIVSKVTACDVFLLLLSPAAQQSEAVNSELDMAWARKLSGHTRIIPLVLEPCALRLDLATLQYISFLAPKFYEQGLDELLTALYTAPAARPLPNTPILPKTITLAADGALALPAPADETPAPEPALPHLAPTLSVFSIAGVFQPFLASIASSSVSIGRDSTNDLVIPDPTVSRFHARLAWNGAVWQAQAAPEAAGFYLNGHDTRAGDLRNGDQLVIGGTVLRFELPSPLLVANLHTTTNPPTVNVTTTPAQLVVQAPECHFVAPLREPVVTLGRAPDCGIVIPSSVVSAHHATLRRHRVGGYTIEDTSAHNGLVYLDKHVSQLDLRTGDRLVIGADIPTYAVTLLYATLQPN